MPFTVARRPWIDPGRPESEKSGPTLSEVGLAEQCQGRGTYDALTIRLATW